MAESSGDDDEIAKLRKQIGNLGGRLRNPSSGASSSKVPGRGKKGGKAGASRSASQMSRKSNGSQSGKECYKCGGVGHFASEAKIRKYKEEQGWFGHLIYHWYLLATRLSLLQSMVGKRLAQHQPTLQRQEEKS